MKHCIHSLFYNIAQTSRICELFCEDYFKKHAQGVNFDDFIILDTIFCYPDLCQRDLAKLVLKGTSHVSKLLFSLEERGLITRPVDTKGKRIVKKIVMTKKGKETYDYALKVAIDYAKQVENSIKKEEATSCIEFLNKIKSSILKTGNLSVD